MTDHDRLQELAKAHLMMHFTRNGAYRTEDVPVISHGEGCWLYDSRGKRYFDGLSGLFCTQIGYSHGAELGEAAAKQMAELPFYTNWSYAHPRSIELSAKVAELAPGDLNRVFFVSGGSEANEAIIKLVKQYHQLRGEHRRYKMIARRIAYHGTTLGALSLTGIAGLKTPFEPLMPGVRHVSNTNSYRRPEGETEQEFTAMLLEELREVIEQEGPESVAAVFMEPVQNAGGTFTPPEGYFQGVREICSEYGVLLVADEVICGFGRLGHWFASERYDIRPDVVTFAKGVGSAHQPLGGVLIRDAIAEPFLEGNTVFNHGITYGGHPVACAVALKNLEVMERLDVLGNVRRNEPYFRAMLEKLAEKPIVGDVRGAGYFMSLELVRDKQTKETFSDEESEHLLRNFLSARLYDAGLICRADDRGDPVIQLSPPLIATRDDIDYIHDVLDGALDEAWQEMTRGARRQAVSG
ncbi:MAG TPA: aspartate aminotransferase family protein [Gaiellales bacterium]|nr:aspartate aminotransferase family protein [Gaiellales bacterium]